MFIADKYSHFIKIKPQSYDEEVLLTKFAYNYVTRSIIRDKETRTETLKPTHVYAARTKDKKEYRFHVNQLPHLLSYLERNRIPQDKIVIRNIPIEKPESFTSKIKPTWVLRDYQQEGVDYLCTDDKYRTKLIELQTGKGKGKLSMFGIAKRGHRTLIVILPRYIDKWVAELHETYDITNDKIMVVQGSSHLKGLIEIAKENKLTADIVIISASTYQNWLTDYEEQTYYDYDICPDELCRLLKVGVLLIDETHQHLHAIFRILMYTHVNLVIGMTATLITDKHDVNVIHEVMYPHPVRFNNLELDCYIDVYAFSYSTHDLRNSRIRTTEWKSNVYSHPAYEKSIIARRQLLENYLKIIDFSICQAYIDIRKEGDKCAVFASTVKMCDLLVSYFRSKYPDYDIRRYCDDDPFENATQPDIRITTIGSMGTAIDIPNLRTVILTVSLSSIQSNIQVLGRLRKLHDRDTRFVYLFNEDIRKHVEYHQKKKELFKDRVKTHKTYRLPIGL